MLFRKEKKCLLRKLFIIVALLFVPFFIILKNTNSVSAASLATASFDLNYRVNNGNYNWKNNIYYGRSSGTSIYYGSARYYQWNTPSVTAQGSYASVHFETNLVISTDDIQYVFGNWVNRSEMYITSCSVNGTYSQPVAQSLSSAVTEWTDVINNVTYYNSTLTVYGDVVISDIPSGNSVVLTCNVGNPNYAFYNNDSDNPDLLYFEQNPMRIEWSNNINDALLRAQIDQSTTIINQNQYQIDLENEAVHNIDTQSTSDIQGATNQQTTSIIGTIASFVTALGSIRNSSQNCQLTLLFPEYAGGEQVVNPCSFRGKSPQIVSIGSSMLLIGFFIPFAFVVLKLIYNEIRSFTNG